MSATKEVLGIIAGGGQFPELVTAAAKSMGYTVAVCAFTGHTDAVHLESMADIYSRLPLGQMAKLVAFFKEAGVQKVCLAGTINKSQAMNIRPDMMAAKIIFSLHGKGDDAILRAVVTLLEGQGFTIVQAADIVTSLRGKEGVLTTRAPSEQEWSDIRFAWPMGKELGVFDIGQCLVVRDGVIIAVEAIEGTDACLERAASLGGKGCVVLKFAKPGQEERVDLPSIGAKTIELMERYGFMCLAFEAGKTLFFDQQDALAFANKHGIAVVGIGAATVE